MSSDTSLVFNLVARDRASEVVGSMKEKFATAATAVSAGVAGAFAVGVTASMDLSSASSKLQAQLGIGPAKAADLSKVAAKVYSQAWGESVGEVSEVVKGVYQQIGDVSKVKGGLESVTTDVMALAQTFDQDLGGVTNAVGQMVKNGLVKDAKEGLDILTKSFQVGDDKAGDLLDTVNEYAPQFAKLHMSGADALSGITQFIRAGAKDADSAADAFKELGLRAIDSGQATTDAYKDLHLNADATRKAIAAGGPSAQSSMQQVFEALKKVKDPVEQNRLGTALMGTQWEDTVRAILPKIDLTKDALGKVSGAADTMAKTVGTNPAAAFESFKRQAMMKLAEVTGGFVQFAMQNQGVFKPLVAVLGVAAGALLAYTLAAKIYAIQQAFVTEGTLAYAAAQWAANSALLANPMTWVVVAIVALVAVIVLIATRTNWFQRIWRTAWGAITGAARATWNWIKKHWPLILGILTGPVGAAVIYITRHWNSVVTFVSRLPGRIAKASAGMWDGIKDAFRASINWVISGWNGLRFSIPSVDTHIPGVGKVGGANFGVPQIPYLAKGGHILTGGWAMVGENGPEAVHLGAGATVAPLTRGGTGGVVTVRFDFTGADAEFKRAIRKLVRVDGRGSVQLAFGNG
jgi:Phage-related minor tail protein